VKNISSVPKLVHKLLIALSIGVLKMLSTPVFYYARTSNNVKKTTLVAFFLNTVVEAVKMLISRRLIKVAVGNSEGVSHSYGSLTAYLLLKPLLANWNN